jgi:hypothetical protein
MVYTSGFGRYSNVAERSTNPEDNVTVSKPLNLVVSFVSAVYGGDVTCMYVSLLHCHNKLH